MKEFVEKLVKEIVDRPEEVVIEENLENVRMPLLELKVAKEDMGKVIGKRGKMIEALRVLVAAASKKHKKRISTDSCGSRLNGPKKTGGTGNSFTGSQYL